MGEAAKLETAIVAGGCFWCVEAIFDRLRGVQSVESGYTGGHVAHPSYKQVCNGDTGHAEAVKIEFDPARIPYGDLLDIFLATHDPTQLNRQGNDVGPQYRSAIFPQSPAPRPTGLRPSSPRWSPPRPGIRPRTSIRNISTESVTITPTARLSSAPRCGNSWQNMPTG